MNQGFNSDSILPQTHDCRVREYGLNAYTAHNIGKDVTSLWSHLDWKAFRCEPVKDVMITHLHVQFIVQLPSCGDRCPHKVMQIRLRLHAGTQRVFMCEEAHLHTIKPFDHQVETSPQSDSRGGWTIIINKRDTVRFLRHRLYLLSPCSNSTLLLKAEAHAV